MSCPPPFLLFVGDTFFRSLNFLRDSFVSESAKYTTHPFLHSNFVIFPLRKRNEILFFFFFSFFYLFPKTILLCDTIKADNIDEGKKDVIMTAMILIKSHQTDCYIRIQPYQIRKIFYLGVCFFSLFPHRGKCKFLFLFIYFPTTKIFMRNFTCFYSPLLSLFKAEGCFYQKRDSKILYNCIYIFAV